LPPNLSTVLNLSCFSRSPESSTLIRPILNHQYKSIFIAQWRSSITAHVIV
jgi:hypothetical protein